MSTYKSLLPVYILIALVTVTFFGNRYYNSIHRSAAARNDVKALAERGALREGDLIFQTSLSAQSEAIQQATHSPFSHCGIIFKSQGGFFVFEAVQPVKYTPLEKWMARGKSGHYIIKRLLNADAVLTSDVIQKMKIVVGEFKNKKYDMFFEWSDDKMYCSELIWKIYKRGADIDIGHLQLLRDFDLTGETVRHVLKERYKDIIPLNDTVISPVSIFNSEKLIVVKSNY